MKKIKKEKKQFKKFVQPKLYKYSCDCSTVYVCSPDALVICPRCRKVAKRVDEN